MSSRIPASKAPAQGVDATTPPWRDHWFPVAFVEDVPDAELVPVSVWGQDYVLFRDANGELRALVDRCPHRSARLSHGRLCGGEVVCLYHGWRFGGDGACRHVPQLEPGREVPAAAAAASAPVVERQGIVWLHGGGRGHDDVDVEQIPFAPELEQPGCRSIDFTMDLPYAQEFLVENVLDYAHIHIAHDGVRGGGHESLAGPLAFELEHRGADGFSARIGRSTDGRPDAGALQAAEVTFCAPNLVHYRSVYPDAAGPRRVSGLLLHSLPLGDGRCRLLYRAYSNFWPLRDRLRPRFWEHGHQCRLLEQDMAVVVGQSRNLEASTESLAHAWLPLKSSDALVVAYRAWIDEYDAERPDHLGLRTRGEQVAPAPVGRFDRWHLHTRHCAACRRALRLAVLGRRLSGAGTVLALAAAVLLPSPWNAVLALTAVFSFVVGTALAGLQRRLLRGPNAASAPNPDPPSSSVP